jgi:lysophospholipase L1-like esterase
MLVIGDSVTEGFGSEGDQYWKELVTNIINEDIKYNRTTNINMLGTVNRSSVTTGGITKYVNAEGRSGWGTQEYYGYANFVDDNNPFYDDTLVTDCKFSINKWLERYRTMDDNGNRLTLGDGTGTEITSSNIDNINVCTPNYVVINLGHNDFYRHDNHRLYYNGILANIRSELPNAKIIVMVTMPAVHTLHKEFYKNYDMIIGAPDINYANRYIANVEYWATYNNTDSNLFILPQYNITPTIESFKYKDVNPNIKAYDHYDGNGTAYGWAHPYKTAHIVWGYELYALVKYIIANEN